jgi:hypothetical protein
MKSTLTTHGTASTTDVAIPYTVVIQYLRLTVAKKKIGKLKK